MSTERRASCKQPATVRCVAAARGPCPLCSDFSQTVQASRDYQAGKLAWCPPELLDERRELALVLGPDEARRIIETRLQARGGDAHGDRDTEPQVGSALRG